MGRHAKYGQPGTATAVRSLSAVPAIWGTSAGSAADTGPHPRDGDWRAFYRKQRPGSPSYRGPRDALTGAPLRTDSTLVMVMRDWDVRRTLHRGSPIPLGLHTMRQDGAVGKCYTPQFARYLAEVRHELTAEQWARLSEWWAVPYVVSRLRATLGTALVEAVLRVTFARDEYEAIARRFQVTTACLGRWERQVYRAARRLLFGPPTTGLEPAPTTTTTGRAGVPARVTAVCGDTEGAMAAERSTA